MGTVLKLYLTTDIADERESRNRMVGTDCQAVRSTERYTQQTRFAPAECIGVNLPENRLKTTQRCGVATPTCRGGIHNESTV